MANSVDPDQTALEQSDVGLHCLQYMYLFVYFILSETLVYKILGHLLYLGEIRNSFYLNIPTSGTLSIVCFMLSWILMLIIFC